MKRIIVLIVVLALIVGAIVLIQSGPAAEKGTGIQQPQGAREPEGAVEQENIGIEEGMIAPNFTLRRFDPATGGKEDRISLNDFRGQPVVIDFWAGWCPFCVEEMPILESSFQQYQDQGLVILGIHRSETEGLKTGGDFAQERGVSYPLLSDASGEVYQRYSGGASFMPLAYFINENGVIQEKKFGPKAEEQIKASIQKILPENQ